MQPRTQEPIRERLELITEIMLFCRRNHDLAHFTKIKKYINVRNMNDKDILAFEHTLFLMLPLVT